MRIDGTTLDMDCIAIKDGYQICVGTWEAADALATKRISRWAIICVLENPRSEDHRPETLRRPVLIPGTGGLLSNLIATPHSLERIAEEIDRQVAFGRNVLVHCGFGRERSPLAMSWWLRTRAKLSLDQAYARLKRRRPITLDCRAWMNQEALSA